VKPLLRPTNPIGQVGSRVVREYLIVLVVSLFVLAARMRSRKAAFEGEVAQASERQSAHWGIEVPPSLDPVALRGPEEVGPLAALRKARLTGATSPPSAPPATLGQYAPTAHRSRILPRGAAGLRRALLLVAVFGAPRAIEPYER
jgi:hypothetical protein